MQDSPSSSILQVYQNDRHDSASSSRAPWYMPAPMLPRTPKVPMLGRMGKAGSTPDFAYCEPTAESSCPVRPFSQPLQDAYDNCNQTEARCPCWAMISKPGSMPIYPFRKFTPEVSCPVSSKHSKTLSLIIARLFTSACVSTAADSSM